MSFGGRDKKPDPYKRAGLLTKFENGEDPFQTEEHLKKIQALPREKSEVVTNSLRLRIQEHQLQIQTLEAIGAARQHDLDTIKTFKEITKSRESAASIQQRWIDRGAKNADLNSAKTYHKSVITGLNLKVAEMEGKNVKKGADTKFLVDFWKWLNGKGEPDDVKKTSWGKVPIRFPDVIAYCDAFVDMRMDFLGKLVKLEKFGPRDLNECYLYFKYIVRGEKDDRSSMGFLEDWDKMVGTDPTWHHEFISRKEQDEVSKVQQARAASDLKMADLMGAFNSYLQGSPLAPPPAAAPAAAPGPGAAAAAAPAAGPGVAPNIAALNMLLAMGPPNRPLPPQAPVAPVVMGPPAPPDSPRTTRLQQDQRDRAMTLTGITTFLDSIGSQNAPVVDMLEAGREPLPSGKSKGKPWSSQKGRPEPGSNYFGTPPGTDMVDVDGADDERPPVRLVSVTPTGEEKPAEDPEAVKVWTKEEKDHFLNDWVNFVTDEAGHAADIYTDKTKDNLEEFVREMFEGDPEKLLAAMKETGRVNEEVLNITRDILDLERVEPEEDKEPEKEDPVREPEKEPEPEKEKEEVRIEPEPPAPTPHARKRGATVNPKNSAFKGSAVVNPQAPPPPAAKSDDPYPDLEDTADVSEFIAELPKEAPKEVAKEPPKEPQKEVPKENIPESEFPKEEFEAETPEEEKAIVEKANEGLPEGERYVAATVEALADMDQDAEVQFGEVNHYDQPYVGPSDIDPKMNGLFAHKKIKEGDPITEYNGIPLNKLQAWRSKSDRVVGLADGEVNLDSRYIKESDLPYSRASWANHSSEDPNAELEQYEHEGQIMARLVAIRPIAKTEEILWDYGENYKGIQLKPDGPVAGEEGDRDELLPEDEGEGEAEEEDEEELRATEEYDADLDKLAMLEDMLGWRQENFAEWSRKRVPEKLTPGVVRTEKEEKGTEQDRQKAVENAEKELEDPVEREKSRRILITQEYGREWNGKKITTGMIDKMTEEDLAKLKGEIEDLKKNMKKIAKKYPSVLKK